MELGTKGIAALKLGVVNISKVMLGGVQVWPTDGPLPPASWELYDEGAPLIGANTFGFASLVYDAGTFIAYVHGSDNRIDRYTSIDGFTFVHTGEVLAASEAWEGGAVGVPQVWKEDSAWYMLYRGRVELFRDRTGLATSIDGVNWTKYVGNPVLTWGPGDSWDKDGAEATSPIKVGDTYYVYYEGGTGMGRQLGVATSTDLITWAKDARNPIISGGVFCPFVWRHSGVYYMLLPRYTNVVKTPSRGVLDLYRCPRPTFYPEEREYLGVVYDSEENSPLLTVPDTPWIVQSDITNQAKVQAGLKVYFSTGASGHDGLYLLEHGDAEVALGLLDGVAFLHNSKPDWDAGTLTDAAIKNHDIVLDVSESTFVAQEVEAATGSSIGTSVAQAVGNSFTTGGAMEGIIVEAKVNVTGTPSHRLKCRLFATSSGLPTGEPLATAFTMHTSNGWARFEFPTLSLAASTQYAYVVGPEAAEGSNLYDIRGDGGANSYPGGTYVYYRTPVSPGWQMNASWDVTFRIKHLRATGGTGLGAIESAELDLSPAGHASGETRISWTAITDVDTGIALEIAVSTDGGSNYGAWVPVTNGGSLPGIPASVDLTDYRLKYRATLTSTDPGKSPRLQRVLVEVQRQ